MSTRRTRWRRAGDDTGAAAVEFALVSIVLVPLLFGMIQYGYYFFQSQSAVSAAREGARLAAVGVVDCATFQTAVQSGVTGFDFDKVSYTLTYPDGDALGKELQFKFTFTPTKFGFPVPFIGGDKTETGNARIEIVKSGSPNTCSKAVTP